MKSIHNKINWWSQIYVQPETTIVIDYKLITYEMKWKILSIINAIFINEIIYQIVDKTWDEV